MKFKHFLTSDGKEIKSAELDGYSVGDRDLEGTTFIITVQKDGSLKAKIAPEDKEYFKKFNQAQFLRDAVSLAEDTDMFTVPGTDEDCELVLADGETRVVKQPVAIKRTSHNDLFGSSAGIGNPPVIPQPNLTNPPTVEEELTVEDVEEVKEPVIGKFTPSKELKNFIVAKKNNRRLHTETAFIKGKELSGMLEDVVLKLTIRDNGTVDFEEVEGTNQCDEAMLGRLLTEIVERDTVRYTDKTVIPSLKFTAGEEHDNQFVYLEVATEEKPFDALQSLFSEEPPVVSDKAKSNLADLLGLLDEEETTNEEEEVVEEETTNEVEEVVEKEVDEKPKSVYQEMIDESFQANKDNKLLELKNRVEKLLKDKQKHNHTLRTAQGQLTKADEDLKVLNARLDSLEPALEENGCVFYVSTEQKGEVEKDEKTVEVLTKLAPIMKLNLPVVIDMLTKGSYTIKIDYEDVYENTSMVADDIVRLVMGIDNSGDGQIQLTNTNEFTYQGEMTWHLLVDKMIKLGFKQSPEYDEICGSPSYSSETSGPDPVSETTEVTDDESTEVGYEKVSGERSPDFDARTIKTFDNETIVVIDANGPMGSSDIEIDDDESYLNVYVGGVKLDLQLTTTGFVNILTLEEWEKAYKNNTTEFVDCEGFLDGIIIPNFTGDVQVLAYGRKEGKYYTKFNENDFIQHQFDDESVDVAINFPEGTNVLKLNEDFSFPLQALREVKLNELLDEEEV